MGIEKPRQLLPTHEQGVLVQSRRIQPVGDARILGCHQQGQSAVGVRFGLRQVQRRRMVQVIERAKSATGQLHGQILGADGVESQDQRLVVGHLEVARRREAPPPALADRRWCQLIGRPMVEARCVGKASSLSLDDAGSDLADDFGGLVRQCRVVCSGCGTGTIQQVRSIR